MNRFSFETLGDRVVPAGLTIAMPTPIGFQTVVTSRPPTTNWISNSAKDFGLAAPTPPPLPGIEGTDVGGDTYYDYHN